MMLPKDMKLLFRADANPRIGTGHVQRCLALGRAWKSVGGTATFVCGKIPRLLEKKIVDEGFEVYTTSHTNCDSTDARETREVQLAVSPDWTVLAGDRFNAVYQTQLRSSHSKLMVLAHSNTSISNVADVVVARYANIVQNDKTFHQQQIMSGSRYLLFAEPNSSADQDKHIVVQARRVFANLLNASDNIAVEVLSHLTQSKKTNLVVDALVGHKFSQLETLRRLKKQSAIDLRFHRNVDHLNQLARRADMAVVCDSSAAYNLAYLGVPTIVVQTPDAESPDKDELVHHGVVENCQLDSFLQSFKQLARSRETRTKMSQRGKQVVDGQGAARICRRLASELFHLREANISDSKQLLDWRNEPEYRALTFDPNPIQADTHQKWMAEKANSNNGVIWIAEDKSRVPIGTIAVDLDDETAKIEICLCPSQRGRGQGPILIEKACRKIFCQFKTSRVLAQIKPGNMASQFAFKKAGFRPIAPTTRDGATAMQLVFENEAPEGLGQEFLLRKSA